MLVTWNWLKDYVDLNMTQAELEDRLSMSGLNHEESKQVGGEVVIDLEVTSNRPDCLGHLGVAREISVLWGGPLTRPDTAYVSSSETVDSATSVEIQAPDLCPRYTARLIRGVKVGPSPQWLVDRLEAIGVASVNNLVDITNFVMMECGQPLHAFDFDKLAGGKIIVREALAGEKLTAIDHKQYELQPGMCVIADAERPVALGGVMGGADSEISERTTNVLIEAAEFDPMSIRNTARNLNLHSPSSYRFERSIDPQGVDWASRRCCQLMAELAGGTVCQGVIDEGSPRAPVAPITLRFAQLKRVLGIVIPQDEVVRILTALGNQVASQDDEAVTVNPPSWRRDLTREIDLIEEVARIHGYDQIPEDAAVPMAPSFRRDVDRVQDSLRHTLTAMGFDEAMTPSVVPSDWSDTFTPWSQLSPIVCSTPMLKGSDHLRRSLIPSLLDTRRINEGLAHPVIEVFEIAHIYLPNQAGLPREQRTLGLTTGGDYYAIKGLVEMLFAQLHGQGRLTWHPSQLPLLIDSRQAEIRVGDRTLGYAGEVGEQGRKQFKLRGACSVAELDVGLLLELATLVPQHQDQSPYPAIARDLNFIVDEGVAWADLESTVTAAAGELLEQVTFQELYRDPNKDGAGKKRLLLSIALRSAERTLTGEEADRLRDQVVTACASQHGAVLLGAE